METLKPFLSEHPFLRGLSAEHLEKLCECALETEFQPGELILREGEIADKLYLIESGKVALESHVSSGPQLLVQHLGAGDVLGWSWLFPPYICHFQARTIDLTRCIACNGAHLLVACERDHEFGYVLMKRFAQVLIRRLQATRKQLLHVHGCDRGLHPG
jgi:CRP-like cAMP-binding protein